MIYKYFLEYRLTNCPYHSEWTLLGTYKTEKEMFKSLKSIQAKEYKNCEFRIGDK